jgi:hypothetical protein
MRHSPQAFAATDPADAPFAMNDACDTKLRCELQCRPRREWAVVHASCSAAFLVLAVLASSGLLLYFLAMQEAHESAIAGAAETTPAA